MQKRISSWMKAAVGAAVSKEMKVMRFGDNMREVAVTEGDKVAVQAKLGWQVNTWAVGDLVKEMHGVSEEEIDTMMSEYESRYVMKTEKIDHVRYQAREEIAIQRLLDRERCKAFTNTFQDLYGMEQLPGLASQDLMSKGYGYGGEGLESGVPDRCYESDGRKRERRFNIYGGLHLPSGQGAGIQSWRPHARSLSERCRRQALY